jgi:hypothetical protein
MDLEGQIVEAMKAELKRQAAEGDITCSDSGEGRLHIEGEVDIEALAMVAVTSVAGGP